MLHYAAFQRVAPLREQLEGIGFSACIYLNWTWTWTPLLGDAPLFPATVVDPDELH